MKSFIEQLNETLPTTETATTQAPASTTLPPPVPNMGATIPPEVSQKPLRKAEKARMKAVLGPAFHEAIDAIPLLEEPTVEERLDELMSASQINTQSVNSIMEQANGNPLRVSNSVNGFVAAGEKGSTIISCVLLLDQEVKTIETAQNVWLGFRGSYKATKYNPPLYFDLRILRSRVSEEFINELEQAQNQGRRSLQVACQGHMGVTGTISKPFFSLWVREEFLPTLRVVAKKVFK